MKNKSQTSSNKNISVILSFLQGTTESGYSVAIKILEDGTLVDQRDSLRISEVAELSMRYENWRQYYIDQGRSVSRSRATGSRTIDFPAAVVGHSSVDECREAAKDLAAYLDRKWFKSIEFQALKDWIRSRTLIQVDKSVPVFFEFDTGSRQEDILLRRLPWSRWDLFKELSNTEPALGIAFGKPVSSSLKDIKILMVLGSDEGGLDLEADDRFVSELQEIGAQVERLSCPDPRELYSELKKNPYDVLFFAGHSLSEEDQRDGTILLQPNTFVSIDSLSPSLQTAVRKGLKLAIFNSCDGLGLADPLIKREKIPSVVVFREPVPDEVARTFLKYFLEEFSSGKPLFLSVREARNQLRFLEDRAKNPLPSASWLPVICQNPSQSEIFLEPTPTTSSSPRPNLQWAAIGVAGVIAGLIGLFSLLGGHGPRIDTDSSSDLKFSGDSQSLEPPISIDNIGKLISNGDKILLDSEQSPQKTLGVEAYQNEKWNEAIKLFREALKLEVSSRDPETWIYLNNAIAEKYAALNGATLIRLGIAISIPDLDPSDIQRSQGQAAELLRGSALRQAEFNCTLDGLVDSLEDSEEPLECKGTEGKFVHLTIADDTAPNTNEASDETKRGFAKAVANALSERNVQAVVGHFSSGNCEAAGEVYQDNQIVMVSPTCTSTKLPGDNEYFFRTVPNDQVAAKNLVESFENIADQQVAVAWDHASSYAESFTTAFQDGLSNDYVYDCDLNPKGKSFSAETCTTEINQIDPDFVLIVPPSGIRSRGLSILDSLSPNITPLGSDSVYGPEVIDERYAQKAFESGLLIYVSWNPNRNSPTPFEENASLLFNAFGWNWRTQSTYDAMSAIVGGIQRLSDDFSGKKLKELLKSADFSVDGVVGDASIRFDENGERILKEFEGKLGVIVKVEDFRSGEDTKSEYGFVKVD